MLHAFTLTTTENLTALCPGSMGQFLQEENRWRSLNSMKSSLWALFR